MCGPLTTFLSLHDQPERRSAKEKRKDSMEHGAQRVGQVLRWREVRSEREVKRVLFSANSSNQLMLVFEIISFPCHSPF